MASLLRSLIAGPRARHPETGLDLCYVTDNIIATSGPSGTYPQLAYRNPLSALVQFLDSKHGANWAIWEFRAEGTGYPDSAVYNRIYHYPFPDHQPPPFAYIPNVVASMRNWLAGEAVDSFNAPDVSRDPDAIAKRVVVIHCKAGKGRTGTMSCAYLMSEQNWSMPDALTTFTSKRMRPGFGAGVSIPSQLRWIAYVDRWRRDGPGKKLYSYAPVEILEIRIWGLREGVTCAVKGYVDGGKTIKTYHTFSPDEKTLEPSSGNKEVISTTSGSRPTTADEDNVISILRPGVPVVLEASDVMIAVSKRYTGVSNLITALAHLWFNTYFEGKGPEQAGNPDPEGTFTIEWDAMDGLKGTAYRGSRALKKLSVKWRTRTSEVVRVGTDTVDDVNGSKE